MKIILLKDIPGYKAREYNIKDGFLNEDGSFVYVANKLISLGWAEEIKDDIDIEEIRSRVKERYRLEQGELDWLHAYRIVKAVIEKLNDDWKQDTQDKDQIFWEAMYDKMDDGFKTVDCRRVVCMNIPCATQEIAEQVISLCEPELKVLFRVQ